MNEIISEFNSPKLLSTIITALLYCLINLSIITVANKVLPEPLAPNKRAPKDLLSFSYRLQIRSAFS